MIEKGANVNGPHVFEFNPPTTQTITYSKDQIESLGKEVEELKKEILPLEEKSAKLEKELDELETKYEED